MGTWGNSLGLSIGDVSSQETATEEQEVATGTFGAMASRFDGRGRGLCLPAVHPALLPLHRGPGGSLLPRDQPGLGPVHGAGPPGSAIWS